MYNVLKNFSKRKGNTLIKASRAHQKQKSIKFACVLVFVLHTLYALEQAAMHKSRTYKFLIYITYYLYIKYIGLRVMFRRHCHIYRVSVF